MLLCAEVAAITKNVFEKQFCRHNIIGDESFGVQGFELWGFRDGDKKVSTKVTIRGFRALELERGILDVPALITTTVQSLSKTLQGAASLLLYSVLTPNINLIYI